MLSNKRCRLGRILRLIGVSSGCYYRSTRKPDHDGQEDEARARIYMMDRNLDGLAIRVALQHPLLGYRKIHHILRNRLNVKINRKRVYRILKENDLLKEQRRNRDRIRTLYQQKLSELKPKSPNEVWQMDVTYIYVEGYGWHYQIDVQDYFSKYVLAQRFTDSFSAKEGILALQEALTEAQRLPQALPPTVTLVTDNGSTFIAKLWRSELQNLKTSNQEELFKHVRIAYRMPEHIGSIERFHGNLKQECVYLNWYRDPLEAEISLRDYGIYYNYERPHWGIQLKTPAEVYLERGYHDTLKFKPENKLKLSSNLHQKFSA